MWCFVRLQTSACVCVRDDAISFDQLFNEFNARSIFSDVNVLGGVAKNPMFIGIILVTAFLQLAIVEVGGVWTETSHLTWKRWLITIGLGAVSLPLGALMRFIPVEEDPDSFAS